MSIPRAWSPPGSAFARQTVPLVDAAIDRAAITGFGASGARLERLTFADGRQLVLKEISPAWDWMMVATNDTGRAAELWVSGAMRRLPTVIDPAIVRIEQTDVGWRIYMRDVDAQFLRSGTVITRADARRLLDALASMHAAFWNGVPSGLCTLEDLIGLMSPSTLATTVPRDHPVRADAERGWEVFNEIAPRDVSEAVSTILARPHELATRLRRAGTTLIHSDPHYGNVAPLVDGFVVIDWSLAAEGPPALDFAWFLDQSGRFVSATADELIDEFRAAEGERHDEAVLHLALLAELAIAGWQYRAAVEATDVEARASRRADFDWWVAAARRGLEAW